MITEAIFNIIIDSVVWMAATFINFRDAPISGTFGIPRPLFIIVELSLAAFLSIYPAVIVFWVWRQIWGSE